MTKTRQQLIASGNLKPAATAKPQGVKADPAAIRSRFTELNKRKVESAVAILSATINRHD